MATNKIEFDSPAQQWEEALPLGNGRLGAMIFGIPDRERIQLNEDSIWSGGFRDRNNPAAKDALPGIRQLLKEERTAEAEELCIECLSGIPPSHRVYQTAGELQISFSPNGGFGHQWSGTRGGALMKEARNYKRKLDISKAVQTLSFEYEDTIFTRECFISNPAQILALRFSAAAKDGSPACGKISFRVTLDRGVFYDRKGNDGDTAFISRDSDIPFCAMFKVVQKGGVRRGCGGFITVQNADEALLFLDIRTNFLTANCFKTASENIEGQSKRSWEELLQEHADDYQSLYNRMTLELGNTDSSLPADHCSLITRYFNFCRYLLISSSRPGSNPANLQGIWNHHIDPPWGSGYTININTQMNYWAACPCNLAETEEPLFDLLERMYPNGRQTAQVMYGCRGFTAHHNTDIWGDTAPRDYWLPGSYWVLGAAWLSLHIWEHYEYTQDKAFLAKYFYLLKEACVFFTDFLTPDKNGFLVVSPSVSPENSYRLNNLKYNLEKEPACAGRHLSLCAGCEMDNQILRKLFKVTIKSAEILKESVTVPEKVSVTVLSDEETGQFKSILDRIAPIKTNRNGAIREWNEIYEEAEPGHRHFSHLFALYPGDEITMEDTPGLAAAALKSIDLRLAANGGHTGWSRAWLVNFMACFGEGETALRHLNAILNDFTLPNLFNTHPPFQIDGNFGSLAGITQMLVQSRIRGGGIVTIKLLPALPREWANGSIKGVRVKGNIELDFAWENGKIISYSVNNKGTLSWEIE